MAKLVNIAKAMSSLNSDLGKCKDDLQKVKILKTVNESIVKLISLHYDPRVEFSLPSGAPPYKPLGQAENEGIFYNLLTKKHFIYFIKGNNINASKHKIESMFIDVLNNVHPDDAVMLIKIKDKVDIWPHITFDLIKRSFPDMTRGWNGKCRIVPGKVVEETVNTDYSMSPKELLTINPEIVDPMELTFNDPSEEMENTLDENVEKIIKETFSPR